jgi:DNA-binding NarL/FixJ family response regulator
MSATGIVISAHDNPSYVARAVVLGAQDFLLRDVSDETWIAAIERAIGGGESAPDTLFSRIQATLHERPDPKADDIRLTISIETVKEHVQNTLRKLELSNRTEAAVWIVKRGLV